MGRGLEDDGEIGLGFWIWSMRNAEWMNIKLKQLKTKSIKHLPSI